MIEYLEILKKCPLFDGICDSDLTRMLGCLGARILSFDKKQTVLAEGVPAKNIGIVLSGTVQIVQIDYYGNRSILSEVASSQVFAEAFACAAVESLPVTVVATEPARVMLIDCDHILHTCSNNCGFHQQLIYNMMRGLAQNTVTYYQRMEIISKRSTREKLMAYLCMQAKKAGSNSFDIPFDRQDLADYLEVDRSGLSAELGKLKKEGVLDYYKNSFKLV